MRRPRPTPAFACADVPVEDLSHDAIQDAPRTGYGAQVWEDGAEYRGEWVDSLACGKGKMKHANGDMYIGQWSRSVAHGFGVFYRTDGTKYFGQFCNDLQDGWGVETFPNGASYAGTFLSGKKSGFGIYTWPDGSKFEGQWSHDTISGVGAYKGLGGRRYQGRWLNSRMHGIGLFRWPDGLEYEGQFVADEEKGFGLYREPNGGMAQWGHWPAPEGQNVLLGTAPAPAAPARHAAAAAPSPAAPAREGAVTPLGGAVRPRELPLGGAAGGALVSPASAPKIELSREAQIALSLREAVAMLPFLEDDSDTIGSLETTAGEDGPGSSRSLVDEAIRERRWEEKVQHYEVERAEGALRSPRSPRPGDGGPADDEASPRSAQAAMDDAIRERRRQEEAQRSAHARPPRFVRLAAEPHLGRTAEEEPPKSAAVAQPVSPRDAAQGAADTVRSSPESSAASPDMVALEVRRWREVPQPQPIAGLEKISEGAESAATPAPPLYMFGATCTANSVSCTVAATQTSPTPANSSLRGRAALEGAYKLDERKLLRAGTYASVYLLKHKASGRTDVIKTLTSDHSSAESQVRLLRRLRHRNIARLLDTYTAESTKGRPGFVHLALECCRGGSLYDFLFDRPEPGGAQPEVAPTLSHQAVSAISYCHEFGVCHRDVKLDNFLLASNADVPNIKLVDFGLACGFHAGGKMQTKVGTPHYIAPEVLLGAYSEKCDVWSLGVVVFLICVGRPPMQGASDEEILGKVAAGNPDYREQDWAALGLKEARAMLGNMLAKNDKARWPAPALLRHKWLASVEPSRRRCCFVCAARTWTASAIR